MGCLLSTKQCLISTFLSSLNACRGLRGNSGFMRLCSVTAKVSQAILPWPCKEKKRTANHCLPFMDWGKYDWNKNQSLHLSLSPSQMGMEGVFCVVIQRGWINKAKHKEVMHKKTLNKNQTNPVWTIAKKAPCSMVMLRVMTLIAGG